MRLLRRLRRAVVSTQQQHDGRHERWRSADATNDDATTTDDDATTTNDDATATDDATDDDADGHTDEHAVVDQ